MADELVFAAYLLTGAIAGLAAGLLGVGGGLIIVPALVGLYLIQHIDSALVMHLALGTSLASIIITSLSSVYAHHRHRAVLWHRFWQLTPGLLFGAWLGGWLADVMSTAQLKPLFAGFELVVAAYMLSSLHFNSGKRHLPNPLAISGAGVVIGGISSLAGVGGGTMTVPYLNWHGVHLRQAIATSAACGLPIALAGTLSYILHGWTQPNLPAWSLGYVHGPSLLGIVISSVLFAPLGAKLAHSLPVPTIRRVFALLLVGIALRLLFSEF